MRKRGKVTESIEKFSVIKTLQAIEDANVVVFVVDATEGVSDHDVQLASFVQDAGRALVVCLNKWDIADADEVRGPTAGLVLVGWIAAVNTASDIITAVQGSHLFGREEGAKASREMVGWLTGGLFAGGVGAGLTAFGAGIPTFAIRRIEAWLPIVVVGALLGPLLYSAALFDALVILFVPWQASVAAALAYGLTYPRQGY